MKELNLIPLNRVIASNQFDLLLPEIKGMFNSETKNELEKYYKFA